MDSKKELADAVRFCFSEARCAQGCKHPDEMDLLREDCDTTGRFMLRLLRGTPVARLRALGLDRLQLNFNYKDEH